MVSPTVCLPDPVSFLLMKNVLPSKSPQYRSYRKSLTDQTYNRAKRPKSFKYLYSISRNLKRALCVFHTRLGIDFQFIIKRRCFTLTHWGHWGHTCGIFFRKSRKFAFLIISQDLDTNNTKKGLKKYADTYRLWVFLQYHCTDEFDSHAYVLS